ncbi:hypothetical protein COU58_02790 [Candidatus Pacearchaeota archaeon CG10_big_fil_rev_8_21_14_0_10_32_42]|nr:MAG: hypothetical protein COU58_02790 [Candidatus Pacearchaeota archaeon CG10_big_fil_rev_8_21_14_0_10_32_42]
MINRVRSRKDQKPEKRAKNQKKGSKIAREIKKEPKIGQNSFKKEEVRTRYIVRTSKNGLFLTSFCTFFENQGSNPLL